MREIFYRGKRLENGQWFNGYYFYKNDISFPTIQGLSNAYILWNNGSGDVLWVEVDPSTVGQYTGLADKNGKKIFEGDIIAGCFRNNHSKQKFRVIFDDGMFLFDNTYVKVPKYEIYSMEVIGNFFDNPELLEGGEDIATEEERI